MSTRDMALLVTLIVISLFAYNTSKALTTAWLSDDKPARIIVNSCPPGADR